MFCYYSYWNMLIFYLLIEVKEVGIVFSTICLSVWYQLSNIPGRHRSYNENWIDEKEDGKGVNLYWDMDSVNRQKKTFLMHCFSPRSTLDRLYWTKDNHEPVLMRWIVGRNIPQMQALIVWPADLKSSANRFIFGSLLEDTVFRIISRKIIMTLIYLLSWSVPVTARSFYVTGGEVFGYFH